MDLEITETLAINHIEEVMEKLLLLNENGIRISIDDFGTGHSSLAYLKDFPIQTLKIAREFILDFQDPANQAIITTIISLAKNLNLTVIAEGVETGEQIQFLKQQGCDEVQGYYFSKPSPSYVLEESFIRLKEVAASLDQ
ncbi:diguanylate cyclase [Jeotgalibacillus soli]|uniref:Diguanylate cyclase n=1 Tax=Jeotgalibacillus soli TaxID=889306 RepID=A0A0C2S3B8_9BACL|nr:diguanylate cyclase [Jeotgalibacillus soli]